MRTCLPLILSLARSFSMGALASTNTPAISTNLLAIYLVADQVPPEQLRSPAVPSGLKLASKPILADADFVTCNLRSNTFVITPVAAMRVGVSCAFREIAFVLVASGEPVYLGKFGTDVSSSGYSGVPTIVADLFVVDSFMGVDHVPDDVWAIMRTRDRVVAEERLVALAKSRPTTNVVLHFEARGDNRIAAAVGKLFGKTKQ